MGHCGKHLWVLLVASLHGAAGGYVIAPGRLCRNLLCRVRALRVPMNLQISSGSSISNGSSRHTR